MLNFRGGASRAPGNPRLGAPGAGRQSWVRQPGHRAIL